MTKTIEDLTNDLSNRLSTLRADRNIHTFQLREKDPRQIIVFSFGHIIKGLERKATLVDLSVTLGRRVRQKFGLKRDSVASCHTGWFVLVSFIELGLIDFKLTHQKTKRGKTSKYMTYHLVVKDKDSLFRLWESIEKEEDVDLFPMVEVPAPWISGLHETGLGIVKKSNSSLLKKFNTKDHSMLFETLNKLGSTAWLINLRVLEVYDYLFENKVEGSPFKHHTEANKEKRESYLIEAESIRRLANKHSQGVFYHLYNCDFRGRIYCNTAFLHEQGSDNAKGLLLMADGEPLGEEGLYWLCLYTANSFGYDKDTLDNRVEYTLKNYDLFLSYAEDPVKNLGWTKADKPWAFLACCFELQLLRQWIDSGGDQDDFVSHLPIWIDGSNNG